MSEPAARAEAIVALDVAGLAEARALIDRLGAGCDFYKVGMELFATEGPAAVDWLAGAGKRVFLDLKFHDIPNTVRGAVAAAARRGARLVTVHGYGGAAMLAAAVEGAAAGGSGCGVLAVTVLTSLGAAELGAILGRPVDGAAPGEGVGRGGADEGSADGVRGEVLRLAALARSAGAHGVVCSGHEVGAVRAAHGGALAPLVPGVRLAGGRAHDQRRVVTPGAAARDGAAYVVLGRTVTAAAEPEQAFARAVAELSAAGRRDPGA